MLRTLKTKFIAITMSLLGLVLLFVLGSSYYSMRQVYDRMVDRALTEAISQPSHDGPVVSSSTSSEVFPTLQCYVVEGSFSQDDVSIDTNVAPLGIDSEHMADNVRWVLEKDVDSGSAWGGRIRWARQLVDDHFTIAFVNMKNINESLRSQLLNSLAILLVAMLVLSLFTYLLSQWAFAPVERSWEQQIRFTADASHELKTPLAVIKANLQILERDSSLSDEDRVWLSRSNDEVRRMQELVTGLLELAETEGSAKASEMRGDTVDFSAVVEKASLQFDPIAFERSIGIETQSDADIFVQGNVIELERLVTILIDNACKYANPGSSIDVHLTTSNASAILTVHNKGELISEEDLPHLFERFYRSDHARTHDRSGGYGLGLAIAKSIAEAHKGTISAQSNARQGTTFMVTLPTVKRAR